MTTIPIIFSFARSGGTLVNQLLGVHPECLILSEVNPACSLLSVSKQASEWLKLVEVKELAEFDNLPYSQQIKLMNDRAKLLGKKLIIRDWVTANYLTGVNGFSTSSGVLEQEVYLKQAGYKMQPLVVTRRASDVYMSIKRSFTHFENLAIEEFLLAYNEYAKAIYTFPKIKLEDLQSAPNETLNNILVCLNLSTNFIDRQLKTFTDFNFCTGNNTLTTPSSSSNLRCVTDMSISTRANKNFAETHRFIEVDQILGYNL